MRRPSRFEAAPSTASRSVRPSRAETRKRSAPGPSSSRTSTCSWATPLASSSSSSLVIDARSDSFWWMSCVVNPGVPAGTSPIATVRLRQRARVAGRVRSVRVQPGAGVSSLECTLADGTGQIVLVFQGRRLVPGIEPGARLIAEGMVGERDAALLTVTDDPDEVVRTVCAARDVQER